METNEKWDKKKGGNTKNFKERVVNKEQTKRKLGLSGRKPRKKRKEELDLLWEKIIKQETARNFRKREN